MRLMKRGLVALCATTVVAAAVVGLGGGAAWATTAVGPVYPAPGGNTLSVTPNPTSDGQSGKAGGINWSLGGFDPSSYNKLFWGTNSGAPPQFSFDGTVDSAGETLSYSASDSDLANGVLRFTGSGDLPLADLSTPTYQTRLTIRVTVGGSPVPLTDAADLPSQGVDGVSTAIGAVMPVTVTSFEANLLFEGSPDGTTWSPANDLYDSLSTPSGAPGTSSWVSGAFYATPPAQPTADLSPNPLAFGSVKVGTSAADQLTLKNNGTAALHITGAAFTGDYGFDGPSSTCSPGSPLAPGDSCQIGVLFSPTATGSRPGTFTLSDDAPGGSQVVNLSGTGTAPAATLTPSPVDFGGVPVGATGSQLATLSNTGSAALAVSAVAVSGGGGVFTQSGGTCPSAPFSLAASGSCTIGVTFSPTSAGSSTGSLTVTDDASGSPRSVALTGIGIAKADVAVFIGDSSTSVPSGSNVTLTVTVQNRGASTATDVTVSETMAPRERFVSLTDGGSDCLAPPAGSVGTISCDIGNMAAHSTVTITITLKIVQKPGKLVRNVANVTATTFDPQLRNNVAKIATLVT